MDNPMIMKMITTIFYCWSELLKMRLIITSLILTVVGIVDGDKGVDKPVMLSEKIRENEGMGKVMTTIIATKVTESVYDHGANPKEGDNNKRKGKGKTATRRRRQKQPSEEERPRKMFVLSLLIYQALRLRETSEVALRTALPTPPPPPFPPPPFPAPPEGICQDARTQAQIHTTRNAHRHTHAVNTSTLIHQSQL